MRKHWRIIIRTAGILLILCGISASYWWFYKLASVRRTSNPEWIASHSQQEYWQEVQESIRRGVWVHGDGFYVGWFGDKSWAEWIVKNVQPGESTDCFGRLCHSSTSMQYLTNQDLGQKSDTWVEWWEKNQSNTQEQWIAEGFAERGIKVDVPPSPDQRPALLAVLGRATPDESNEIHKAVKYNAFRCLRDTDFDPVEYALSTPKLSDEIKRGLQEYEKLERRWPTAMGLGILHFGKDEDAMQKGHLPSLLTVPFQTLAYTLSLGTPILGLCLILWSLRRKINLGV
jgi:hypothetical protein